MDVAAGDVVIIATDGMFDTLWAEDVVGVVRSTWDSGEESVATALTEAAQLAAINSRKETPFGERAKEEGIISRSGEVMDDVAVVVISLC